jgi:alpha-tubulin suppressor-like RCC1 family protein
MEPCPFAKDGQTPLDVIAGSGYSALVTEEGSVYSWGGGEFGRLGYCDTRRQALPR